MASRPAEASSESATPSRTQYNPDTDHDSSRLMRPGVGKLKIQTDLSGLDADTDTGGEGEGASYSGFSGISDEEANHNGYRDSGRDIAQSRQSPKARILPDYTVAEEREVVRIFDRKLVPFMALLYLLSFLDRSNIGNAKTDGLSDDLNLSSEMDEWLLTAFYITYVLFEWMTLMYRLVPPHIYVSLCVCGWGLVTSFQSLTTSFGGMLVLRLLLGITEAAFGPGVPFYLSLFYKREELAFRVAMFISAAPLASSFTSVLAWVIVRLSQNGPIAPWRTLFLVEGFPSIVLAVFAWMAIPDGPGKAHFLTPRLRKVARVRLGEGRKEESYHESRDGRFGWEQVWKTQADPKAYITASMFFSCNVAFSSMGVFLPTIIRNMGYTPQTSQALTAPPYLVAFLTVLLTTHFSDRTRTRSPYLITHALLASLSYLALALTGAFHEHLPATLHIAIRYICVFPAVAGFFTSITLIVTWTMDNQVASEGKGTGVAMLNIIGQCGPFLGVRLFPRSTGPWYVSGMGVCSGFMGLVGVLAGVLRVILMRQNRAAVGRGGNDIEIDVRGEEREGLMGDGDDTGGGGRGKEIFTYII